MELLVPEMGFLLIQIETDTDAQGAVSELVFSLLFPSCFIALIRLAEARQVLPLVSKMYKIILKVCQNNF